MAKFKNKKTKKIIEENLIYYVDKLRKNSEYEEVKETKTESSSNCLEKNNEPQK